MQNNVCFDTDMGTCSYMFEEEKKLTILYTKYMGNCEAMTSSTLFKKCFLKKNKK